MQAIKPAILARAGLIIIALAVPGAARGQSADIQEGADKPWAAGISMEQRQAARDVFLAGNKLFNEALFGKAAEKYQQALALLPHPFIGRLVQVEPGGAAVIPHVTSESVGVSARIGF